MTFEALKETFRAKGQAQYIDYLNNITGPQGRGHWTFSINHLAPNNPAPQIWCTWEGAYRIQDAVLMQDYPPPTGANGKARAGIPTYPVTLLWYPRMEKTNHQSNSGYAWAEESLLPGGISPFDDDDDLVSVRELFARVEPGPAAATTTSAAGTHKRQISEAVPRDERPNRPETTPAAPLQQQASGGAQEAQGADTGAGIGVGAANDTCKSGS